MLYGECFNSIKLIHLPSPPVHQAVSISGCTPSNAARSPSNAARTVSNSGETIRYLGKSIGFLSRKPMVSYVGNRWFLPRKPMASSEETSGFFRGSHVCT